MNENSIVRENLMTKREYAPYCSNCSGLVRLKWSDYLGQFYCGAISCDFVTDFPKDFINRYKTKWNLKQ